MPMSTSDVLCKGRPVVDTYSNPAGTVSVTVPKPAPSMSICTVTCVPGPGITCAGSKDRVALALCAAKGDALDTKVKPPTTLSSSAAKIISLFKAFLL